MPQGVGAGGDLFAPRVHTEATGAKVKRVGTAAGMIHQAIHVVTQAAAPGSAQ